jgi:dTDP-glucose 4,6-dehydratase
VEGIYRLLLSDYTGPVNIGNPNEISLKNFAEEVLKLTGSTVKIAYKELPVDDPKQRQPDISLAKAKLDWEPKVKLEDGLKETIAYFRKLLQT